MLPRASFHAARRRRSNGANAGMGKHTDAARARQHNADTPRLPVSLCHLLRAVLVAIVVLVSAAAGAQTASAPDVPTIPESLPDLGAYEGKTVVARRSIVEGQLWTLPPSLEAPKIGTPFSVAKVRAELLRLLEGGGFATGSVEVDALGDGVEVVFRLVPARFVQRVVMKGNVLGDDEVRRAGGLVDVRDITQKSLAAAAEKMRVYYVQRGFPKAKIEIASINTEQPLVVIVQVTIDPGAPVLVERRVLAGLHTFDHGAVAAGQAYKVASGERADQEELEAADRDLTTALRAGGFPSAVVTHAVAPGTAGNVVLTINVVPGARVVPDFEGNTLFDRARLLEILDLKGEADRSPMRLASKIEGAYRRLGYYDVFVEPELLGNPKDQQRTLRFRIREGHVVTVAKREYPCLSGALKKSRIDEEIDSFLEEELSGEGFGDGNHHVIDSQMGKSGDVALGARPRPDFPEDTHIFAGDTYDRAREHLIELFRSEGYMFVEIGEVGLVRGSCAKGSMPGPNGCKVVAPPAVDDKKLCLFDSNQLPLPVPELDKKLTCEPDPLKGIECAPSMKVVLPINPGPRSYLWDIAIDGTYAIPPATLMGPKVAGAILRMGDPLSLRDAEAARKAIVEYYRDEGYYFVSVRVAFEYSGDKSRARLRFIVTEGEQVVIENLFVEGEKKTSESLILDRLLIKKGGIYRARLVRESQERLAKLGVFQSISIGLVNPTIPAKRKTVVVSVRERPPHHVEGRIGYSTGEGIRAYGEYGYANLFGYAISFDVRARISYQPFLGASCGPNRGDPCSGGGLYDSTVVRRWVQETDGLERLPRRIGAGFSLPHTPLLGADVRTTLEVINVLDLRRDFVGDKYILPAVTMTYTPWQPLTLIFGGGFERNNFKIFDSQRLSDLLKDPANQALAAQLRVPEGSTSVLALSLTSLFDFRDNRLGATKNGYVSFSWEYVRSFDHATDTTLGVEPEKVQAVRSEFVHVAGGGGAYYQLKFLPKKPVLAFELRGGGNFNLFSCTGFENTKQATINPLTGERLKESYCDTYPDRLFYLGGFDSTRGFFQGTMLPQDSIDDLLNSQDPNLDKSNLAALAQRGGNVFINPRLELRIPAFKWGGFVFFVDAANTWRDKSRFQPFLLRYAVGPGLSIDTPVGPVAIDFGFNLSRYSEFNEPLVVPYFSIGRF